MLAGFIVSFSLIAQKGDYSISGVVVNAQTGEPVKYALVTLMGFQKPDPQQQGKFKPPLQKSTQAGAAGEFQFQGLGNANYNLSAQKPGFNNVFSPNDLKSRLVDLSSSVSGVEVKLSPLGVIEGKVIDQNDEPLRGVNVLALQVQINDGQRDTNAPRSVATDDRGMYRLWNLPPGRYYMKAAGKSGGTNRYVGDSTPYYSSWQSFAPVYFGGGQTLDAATPISIGPGSNAAADFHLNLEPAYRIRGTLANVPSGTITFELLQGPEDVSASRTSLNATTGKFEVQDVTPGNYLLRAYPSREHHLAWGGRSPILGGMSRTQEERRQLWRKLIAEQERSGLSVRAFSKQHRTSEHRFYQWRKRLAEQLPMKFALVETNRSVPAGVAAVEVILSSGERLRIAAGIDAATLRLVLSVLREPR
jgi:hypothetical protein